MVGQLVGWLVGWLVGACSWGFFSSPRRPANLHALRLLHAQVLVVEEGPCSAHVVFIDFGHARCVDVHDHGSQGMFDDELEQLQSLMASPWQPALTSPLS